VIGKSNNSWIFNINLILNMSFSIWIFTTASPLQKVKRKLFLLLGVFIVFALLNLLCIQGLWRYNVFTEIAGDVILAGISCYFFYTVLTEETFRNLFSYEFYWFANGLLINSLGAVVLYIFLDYLWGYYKQTGINVYGYINYGINVLLYGSLIVAFICRYRNTK
jgi:hypothetical protein